MDTHVTKILTLEGMSCASCETRLEQELSKLPGVVKVEADYAASELKILYASNTIDILQIIKAIEAMGYWVKDTQEDSALHKDRSDHGMPLQHLIGIAIIFAALYLVLNRTIGFGFLPQINQDMGYGLLLVVGLITSIHCVAMCGGITISQSVGVKIDETEGSKVTRMKPGLLYNLGRVISYTIIGGLAGALGSIITFSGTAKGVVAIAAGLFLAIMGLNMLNVFPWLRKINPRLPKGLSRFINKGEKQHGPLYVGLLNGLMPCGPLQAMQLYALGTGSALVGAFSMMVFSLGTVPMMLGLGAVSSFLSSKFKYRMLQVSGVLVVMLGIIMLSRGINLSGINLAYASPPAQTAGNVARVDGKVQVVKTTLESGRYKPIFVQKGIPVQWTINASDDDLNGCNNPITIPKYNIQKKLVAGDNLIEFTPQEEGTITYTCWMGMISSTINVVSDLAKISSQDTQSAGAAGSGGTAGAGCCQGLPSNAASSGISLPGCCKPPANVNNNTVNVGSCCK